MKQYSRLSSAAVEINLDFCVIRCLSCYLQEKAGNCSNYMLEHHSTYPMVTEVYVNPHSITLLKRVS